VNLPRQIGPSTVDYQGRIFEIVRTPMLVGGKRKEYETAVRSPGVRVIALDSEARLVYLTKELRSETEGWDLRVPGGKVFDEIERYLPYYPTPKTLSPQHPFMKHVVEAAEREAGEELGAELHEIELLGKSVCGATVHWDLYIVTSQVCGFARTNAPEPGETIKAHPVEWREALELIDAGVLSEERSAIWLRRTLLRLMKEERGG